MEVGLSQRVTLTGADEPPFCVRHRLGNRTGMNNLTLPSRRQNCFCNPDDFDSIAKTDAVLLAAQNGVPKSLVFGK